MVEQKILAVKTGRRGTYEITDQVQAFVRQCGIKCDIESGLCHVYIRHTSASLIVCENADPTVRQDLEMFFSRTVIDGDPEYRHDMEGPDDMSAHIRTILTQTSLSVPVMQGQLAVGTWQGIYVYEHRYHAGAREVIVSVQA